MKETVLLVDGDIIAYRSAAASEVRSVIVTHEPTGVQKSFQNKTEFRKMLKERDKLDREPEYSIREHQEPFAFDHCIKIMNKTISDLTSITWADRVEIYVSGDKNFREDLPLPQQYKGNREDSLRPVHLKAARQYLRTAHKAVKVVNEEADDTLSIRGYEELAKGNQAIIASNDKDTKQAEGLCFYDWTVEHPTIFEIPEIGELTKTGSTIKGAGLKFFAFQLLFGDPVDFYKPSYLVQGLRYGATSAYNDLKDCNTKEEILNRVIKKYREWYPRPFEYDTWNGIHVDYADWQTMLDLFFKLAYMRRSINDQSEWKVFFAQRGVHV